MPRLLPLFLLAASLAPAIAPVSAMEAKDIRVGPQVLLGSSGFEPGAFAEFTWDHFRLRPELFVQDFERPAAGADAAPVDVVRQGDHAFAEIIALSREFTDAPSLAGRARWPMCCTCWAAAAARPAS